MASSTPAGPRPGSSQFWFSSCSCGQPACSGSRSAKRLREVCMPKPIRTGITFGIIGGVLTFIFGGWSVLMIGLLMGAGLGLSLGSQFKRRPPLQLVRQALPAVLASAGVLLVLSILQNYIVAPAVGNS